MLVIGLQSTRVRASESLFQPRDLGWLDSCEKQRHEGG
ncbi:integrase [Rhizobium sp. ZX09]|nr:integrase [Rhizobium sp. ZX09]